MLGTCEVCGTSLTIQNSQSFVDRGQVRARHVPGNCAQVLYSKLVAAQDEIAQLKALNKADRHARAECAEAQDKLIEEAMAQTLVVLLFIRNDGRWTAKQRVVIEAAIAKCTRVAAPKQVTAG